MHGLSAIDDDRRSRPARADAPPTAHPRADAPLIAHPAAPQAAVPRARWARAVRR
ncbi:hypothetical protein [Micromonospora sp. NPDC005707]|uniref:hypothetical protein n=1 Tax=Micromonospora sp. NPDC005707 TaxID=3157050 RepID=UPI003400A546